jgi:hypothetical protein
MTRTPIKIESRREGYKEGGVINPRRQPGLRIARSSVTGPETVHTDAGIALATQRVECFLQAFPNAGKYRRIAQGIPAALGFSQCHDKI